ncbi:MAG: hypothetical protein WCK75_08240 [Elusimicrobiota bacterium]
MEELNDKSPEDLAGEGEGEDNLRSAAFHSVPVPAPVPPSPAAPKTTAPLKNPADRGNINSDTRFSGIESMPREAGLKRPVPPPPPSQDRELLNYLKHKINELEGKLRESQEKGLAFAYELKGREEARKESRREMTEFLAEVKKQQAESESERAHGLEMEKARARIEALELKIMEFSAPRPEPPVPPQPAISVEEFERMKAGLKAELAVGLEILSHNFVSVGEVRASMRKMTEMEVYFNNFSSKIAEQERKSAEGSAALDALEGKLECFKTLIDDLRRAMDKLDARNPSDNKH